MEKNRKLSTLSAEASTSYPGNKKYEQEPLIKKKRVETIFVESDEDEPKKVYEQKDVAKEEGKDVAKEEEGYFLEVDKVLYMTEFPNGLRDAISAYLMVSSYN